MENYYLKYEKLKITDDNNHPAVPIKFRNIATHLNTVIMEFLQSFIGFRSEFLCKFMMT
jgi:hypothetical protein